MLGPLVQTDKSMITSTRVDFCFMLYLCWAPRFMAMKEIKMSHKGLRLDKNKSHQIIPSLDPWLRVLKPKCIFFNFSADTFFGQYFKAWVGTQAGTVTARRGSKQKAWPTRPLLGLVKQPLGLISLAELVTSPHSPARLCTGVPALLPKCYAQPRRRDLETKFLFVYFFFCRWCLSWWMVEISSWFMLWTPSYILNKKPWVSRISYGLFYVILFFVGGA